MLWDVRMMLESWIDLFILSEYLLYGFGMTISLCKVKLASLIFTNYLIQLSRHKWSFSLLKVFKYISVYKAFEITNWCGWSLLWELLYFIHYTTFKVWSSKWCQHVKTFIFEASMRKICNEFVNIKFEEEKKLMLQELDISIRLPKLQAFSKGFSTNKISIKDSSVTFFVKTSRNLLVDEILFYNIFHQTTIFLSFPILSCGEIRHEIVPALKGYVHYSALTASESRSVKHLAPQWLQYWWIV